MSRQRRYVTGLLRILFGYGAASLATGAFAHALLILISDGSIEKAPWAALGGLPRSMLIVSMFAGVLAFAPALVLIGIAEMMRLRSPLYYGLAGGTAALVVLLLMRMAASSLATGIDIADQTGQPLPLGMSPAFAFGALVGGTVAGLVYWAIAGRFAGDWLSRAASRA